MQQQARQQWSVLAIIGFSALVLLGSSLAASIRAINNPFPGFFVHENLTVGPYFLPSWSGQKAGIQSLDRVVAVNGAPLERRADLYEQVQKAPAGTLFRYTVERHHKTVDLTVATMRLAFSDWFLIFGVYLVMGLAFLVIGVAPYYYRASSPAALPLCFMVIAVFVWFVATFDFMTLGALPKELRIFGLTLTPSAAIHLAWLLTSGQSMWRNHPVALVVLYALGLALGGLISTTFFGPLDLWFAAFRAGYLFTCFGALSFLFIVGTALRGSLSDLDRSRLRVMFVGALFGFLIPTVATVLTSSFQWRIPYNLALVPTVCFPLSVAYALLKYSLFDLGNALKIAVSRIALTVALLAIYVLVVHLLGPWAGMLTNDPLVPLFFSILVVLLFNPLLRRIETVVDRYVYRLDYDPVWVRNQTSLFLRSLAPAPELAEGYCEKLRAWMGLESVTLAYQPHSGEACLIAPAAEQDAAAAGATRLCHLLQQRNDIDGSAISRSEIATDPRFQNRREDWLASFAGLANELLVPVIFENQVRGLVAFGAKRSRREYNAEDVRLLTVLTDQLALSLENGRLYDESVQAYRKAEAANQKLIEMDRIKKDFVANICHEIRTPVSTIIGYGEILADKNFSGDANVILARLINKGQELASLMDNLMNFTRMENDGATAHLELVKLHEILAGLKMMTQRLIRERPIEVGIEIEPAIEAIESDGQKLQQILVELVTNALKFTKQGKVELAVRKTHEAGRDFVEIAVADTGPGIKAEDQELIFEDFRQLDGSSSRTYGGTGLGLGLCKKLAAALGGTIRLSSELGVGSVFSLLLPVKGNMPRADGKRLLPALG
ncbi:MAG: GAF domain-containing protein [Deltaproteobacteria bacterium]|nr:GAF domain-containing protein [Deltaproteobacteria bacterium]